MHSPLLHSSPHNYRATSATTDAGRRLASAGSYDHSGLGFLDSRGLHNSSAGQSLHSRSSAQHGSFATPASIHSPYHIHSYNESPSPTPTLASSQHCDGGWQSTRPSPPLPSGTPSVHVTYSGASNTSGNTRNGPFTSQPSFSSYQHTHGSLSPHFPSVPIPSGTFDNPFTTPSTPSFSTSSSYTSTAHSGSYCYTVQPAASNSRPREAAPHCEWADCRVRIEDPTPAGIARHLRQYHNILVTDNRHRNPCLWGEGCGKDMFPSSLGKHIAECHLRNMVKQCPHCGADFARADTLSRHVKAFCPNASGQ
ncbi:hypothetical protein C2E23DRAFT_188044 [Lenzites betulinus]|nr:hypothetical protein C2E23DRAFT_188044 [Lenzites betulinus]